MPTIMCTRNLWRAIGGRTALPARTERHIRGTKLGAWSARELPTRVGHLVVGVEEHTYLTVLCPLLPQPEFIHAFAASVEAAFGALGLPVRIAQRETQAIVKEGVFAKNDNRSLLGSVNDVAFHASVLLEDERHITFETLHRIQMELNQMPHVHREPPFPDQAVRSLFGEAHVA